jgi:hypothetical protein
MMEIVSGIFENIIRRGVYKNGKIVERNENRESGITSSVGDGSNDT